jgi:hypothetical protein
MKIHKTFTFQSYPFNRIRHRKWFEYVRGIQLLELILGKIEGMVKENIVFPKKQQVLCQISFTDPNRYGHTSFTDIWKSRA